MANIFTIKHGQGEADGKLNPYELGYRDNEGKLYIGGPLKDKIDENGNIEKDENGNPIKVLGDAIPVSGNIEIIENSAGGQFVYYRLGTDGKVQLSANEKLIVPSNSYGSSLPTTGQNGQVYFVI